MQNDQPEFDTSVRKLAVLPNGDSAIIQGQGLRVEGTEREIDITQIDENEFKRLNDNVGDIRVSQNGDKITLTPKKGKPIIVRAEQ